MQGKKFSIRARLQSFVFAFNGVRLFIQKEHNAWIHLLATVVAVTTGFLLSIQPMEWVAIVFAIGLVWVTEMLNTCLERTMDLISLEKNEKIKIVKDIAAGAVLIASIIALVIAFFVFLPYLITQ